MIEQPSASNAFVEGAKMLFLGAAAIGGIIAGFAARRTNRAAQVVSTAAHLSGQVDSMQADLRKMDRRIMRIETKLGIEVHD